jgi:hypothetical protein
MQKGWLSHAGVYPVDHVPFEDAGPLLPDAYAHPRGIQHTTEGSTVEGALAAYRARRCAPTFTVGYDAKRKVRIIQHVPLGNAARAVENHPGGVETNRVTVAQIELVGISPVGRAWQPDDPVLAPLAAVYWQLWKSCGIPLAHIANPLRSGDVWDAHAGWFGHADVPENAHVDPRDLRYANVFARAHAFSIIPPRPPKVRPNPRPKMLAPGVAVMLLRARKTPAAALCGGARPSLLA